MVVGVIMVLTMQIFFGSNGKCDLTRSSEGKERDKYANVSKEVKGN
jgi:hypothetical protein